MSASDMREKQEHQHHYGASEVFAGKETTKRARLLEESKILPGEASFATVKLSQNRASGRYSPASEFLGKGIGKLAMGMLVVVLVGGFITFAVLKAKSRSHSVPDQNLSIAPITSSSQATPLVPQPMPTTAAHESAPVLKQTEGRNAPSVPATDRVNSLRPKLVLSSAPKSSPVSEDENPKEGAAEPRTTASSIAAERSPTPAAETHSPPNAPPAESSTSTSSKPKVIPWP